MTRREPGRSDRAEDGPRNRRARRGERPGSRTERQARRENGTTDDMDELMRTAHEKTNCHHAAIYSCRGRRSRLVPRLVRASCFSSRPLPACLPRPGVLVSSHPVFSVIVSFLVLSPVSFIRLVRLASRRFSLLAYPPRLPAPFSFAHAVIGYRPMLRHIAAPGFSHHDGDGNRGDETMRRAGR